MSFLISGVVRSFSPLILALASIQSTATGQPIDKSTIRTIDEIIEITPMQQARKGVDYWPLILSPRTPAELKVNARLSDMNGKLVRALKECDTDYIEWAKMTGFELKGKDSPSDDWERKIEVTMVGPHFLSVVAVDEFVFCGGVHPSRDTNAQLFDLTTGDAVHWISLISKSSGTSAHIDTSPDGSNVEGIVLPALRKMAVATAAPDCKSAFWPQQAFQIWPDAQEERLIAEPLGLAHAVQACGKRIHLTLEQVRQMGFSETLLQAVRQAHLRSTSRRRHRTVGMRAAQAKSAASPN